MKIVKIVLVALVGICVGCTSAKFWIASYSIHEIIEKKNAIDSADNPAMSFVLLDQLDRKKVVIEKGIVKQVMPSANIDYKFCVIVTVEHSSGVVECYVYTKNWLNEEDLTSVAELKPGDVVYVVGRFSRFLKLLGQQYAVELLEANLSKK